MERMANLFEQLPQTYINRSKFDRSCGYKTTVDADYLYPVFFDEVLPGDTKQLNTTVFGRMTTPFVPVMDNIWLDIHYFYVPLRLLWSNFKKFMGERENPTDSIDYVTPKINSGVNGFGVESLFDYLSLPPSIANLTVDAFYSRAYNLIWNEWYRDENLQNSVVVDTDDGPDTLSDYVLLKRGKRFDYFTSALPSPQKGPGATLPLGTTASVTISSNNKAIEFKNLRQGDTGIYNLSTNSFISGSSYDARMYMSNAGGSFAGTGTSAFGAETGLTGVADLSNATAATINSLRTAIALQQFLEADQRGGTRYKELVYQHFGTLIPDYRLQRPEYLGGGSTRINISPIAQTSSSDSTSPQGNLAAYGTVASTGTGFTHSFTEHGIILGLASIRSDISYQQGVDRMFKRHTRYDYFWPTLAHVGEQKINNYEIYAQGESVVDADGDIIDYKPFGYQERYAEYRYKNSYITGKLRSTVSGSLDIWHLAEEFSNLPTLSSQFIQSNSPIDRVLAVQNEPQFYLDLWHDYTDIRPIPVHGTPGLTRI